MLLGKGFPLDERLGFLNDLRLCSGIDILTVSPQAAERQAELTPAELCRILTARAFAGPQQRVLALLYRGAPVKGHAPAWFTRAAVERALRIGHLSGPFYFSSHQNLRETAHQEATQLLKQPGVEVQGGKESWVRLLPLLFLESSANAGATGRIHLQPSFELLVPPDVAPRTLIQLGQMADLQKFDQVATFVLNKASVARAVEQGQTVESLLLFLKEHASAGVPQNVAASVRSWAGQSGQARFAQGLVLLIRADVESLATSDPVLNRHLQRRLGPGAFLVAEAQRGAIEKRLRALDILPIEGVATLSSLSEEPESSGLIRYRDLLPHPPEGGAAELRARVTKARTIGATESARPFPGGDIFHIAAPPPKRPPAIVRAAPTEVVPKKERDADHVPPHVSFMSLSEGEMERVLRTAIRRQQTVYVHLSDGHGPWAIQPQRISHRGRLVFLEGFRTSAQEYRSLPLSVIVQLGM